MRFRKSIKIFPGLKLNISKSGVSCSAGVRGLTMTMGNRGTYLNTGIPGTGLYDRKRIDGPGRKSSYGGTYNDNVVIPNGLKLMLQSDGKVHVYDKDDIRIEDPALLRAIKRSPSFQEGLANAQREMQSKIANEIEQEKKHIDELKNINSRGDVTLTHEQFEEKISNLTPEVYQPESFKERPPVKSEIYNRLYLEAKTKIKDWKFWSWKSRRKQYAQDKLDDSYNKEFVIWQEKKTAFDADEAVRANKINEQLQLEYATQKEYLQKLLIGEEEWIDLGIEDCINSMNLPIEFFVQHEYEASDGVLFIDLDLPEIEDIPAETLVQTSYSKTKNKKRTQLEIRTDYMESVFGLGLLLANQLFNVSPQIREIVTSGYTQRRNKEGDINDDYIYSVRFTRDKFEQTNIATVNPKEFFMTFENRCKLTSTNLFKTIKPYETRNPLKNEL